MFCEQIVALLSYVTENIEFPLLKSVIITVAYERLLCYHAQS